MKTALMFLILVASTFLAVPIQDLLPPLVDLKNTQILLVPIIFSYGALILPYPAMLALAVIAGFLTDLSVLQIVDGKVEIALGWSIVIYTVLGSLMQGVRKAFFEGAWWIHPPLSALCTFTLLTLQYLMITLRRESIIFNETVLWKILAPTVLTFLISPMIEALFLFIERSLPDFRRSSQGY